MILIQVPWVNQTDLGSHGGTCGGSKGEWNFTISVSQTFSFLTENSSVLKWNLLVPLDTMQKKTWFHFQVCLYFVRKSLFYDIFDIIKKISHNLPSQFYKSCFCYWNFAGNFRPKYFFAQLCVISGDQNDLTITCGTWKSCQSEGVDVQKFTWLKKLGT